MGRTRLELARLVINELNGRIRESEGARQKLADFLGELKGKYESGKLEYEEC